MKRIYDVEGMMQRFAASANLLRNLLPQYETGLDEARVSFRPVEIAGRRTSWRKDDTSARGQFPSSPTQEAEYCVSLPT
jgi:hypothetical protein